jgi:hypothetical protein
LYLEGQTDQDQKEKSLEDDKDPGSRKMIKFE